MSADQHHAVAGCERVRDSKSISAKDVTHENWVDWKWQQRNAVTTVSDLESQFPGLLEEERERVRASLSVRRFSITPYALTLIGRTSDGRAPLGGDPIWRQLAPRPASGATIQEHYDAETDNWEFPHEMVTPICQHKYPNRVIIRLSNVCHAYCQFCYEALRTLEKSGPKAGFKKKYWNQTLAYIRESPAVEEIILSGGEPLMHDDEQLDAIFGDLRAIERRLAIRVHTRALTFNPYRITAELVEIFRRNRVSALGLHVTHPRELTPEFEEAVAHLRQAVPIIFANIPLLRGVNNDLGVIRPLCMSLYGLGVLPHYLYHFMPFSPGIEEFRTSIRQGIEIVQAMKRHVTNLAVPEFVLPHRSGKFSIPLFLPEQRQPEWRRTAGGRLAVVYENWCGELVEYLSDEG